MNILDNIIITSITHVFVVNYKNLQNSKMYNRPWYGIAFSLGGELIYSHNSNQIKLSSNQVVFIPKNSTYDVLCTVPGSFAVINFLTTQDLTIDEFITTEMINIDALKNEFSIMHSIFVPKSAQPQYNNLSSLYKILSILTTGPSQKQMPSVLYDALRYIDTNISNSTLSNLQIANHLGISEVYLRKLFSEKLSISPYRHIQNKRIERAKKLLIETTKSITEISETCGYSCIYYFCNSFKHQTGYTPTQYRHNNSVNFFK